MEMLRNKKLLFIQVTISIAIMFATISSVVLASFQASKTNTSSLTFRGNITLTVSGVTKSGDNYYWDYKTRPGAASYTAGVAEIHVVDYLELAPITITVTTGATCYVRLFACVGTEINSSIYPVANFPSLSGASNPATVITSANYVTNESNFAFTNTTSQTKKFVSQVTVSSNNTTYTMSQAYIPYNAQGNTEYSNADLVNKKFYLYLSVSASTDNVSWNTFVLTPTN